MRELQEKRKWRRIVNSKIVVVLLAIVVLFLARATWGVYQKERESAANVLRVKNQLTALEDRQNVLSTSLQRLGTTEGIEEDIRSKYSVSKPGEAVVVVVGSTTTATSTSQQKESWWEKFTQLFK